MARDRALGLAGFAMALFRVCWDVVRDDAMKVFLEFYSFMKFEKNLNATFIVLIAKKVGTRV